MSFEALTNGALASYCVLCWVDGLVADPDMLALQTNIRACGTWEVFMNLNTT